MFGRRRKRDEMTLQRLDALIRMMEEALDKDSRHRVQVQVEHLHVQEVSLDEFVFRLDQLNIDDLSGSLNLGNNFGTDHIKSKRFRQGGIESHGTSFGQYDPKDFQAPAKADKDAAVAIRDDAKMQWTERGYQVSFGRDRRM